MSTMGNLLPWLFFSGARDADGEPVSSGFIYFYEPGSTTIEVSVYADPELTELLDQPVALDAAGCAEVYIASPAEIVVKDADGVQVKLTTRGVSVSAGTVDCTWSGAASTLNLVLAAIQAALTAAASDVPAETYDVTTVPTENPSFEFNPDKTINVFNNTYDDTSATFTITWPSPAPTLAAGTKYRLILVGNGVGGGATSASSLVFPGEILTDTPPTSILTGTAYSAEFIATTNDTIVQVTPWVAVDGGYF
jgi:hypothetical protein